MARKKQDTELQEETDDAAMETEVLDSDGGTDEGAPGENPQVNLTDQEKKPEPGLTETTKAEQEAGRKSLEEREKSRKAE
jgi:hypothetical protein